MDKKIIYGCMTLFILILSIGFFMLGDNGVKYKNEDKLVGTVISVNGDELTIKDEKNSTYTFKMEDVNINVGSKIVLEYTGLLDRNQKIQNVSIIDYEISQVSQDSGNGSIFSNQRGIFNDYYLLASEKVKTLSLDEKIGQLFLVRYPDSNQAELLKKYNFAGYVFFEKDFRDKTKSEVKTMINSLQDVALIPILTAVDEEGGSVVRVSSNPNLVSSRFKSSKELYSDGGFQAISNDTVEKSRILYNLGLNVNLAPVVDVSEDPNDYMYARSFGKNAELTSTYAKTVIEASQGTGVSYVMKHFPGYGNNQDTHTGTATDNRTYDYIIENDLLPFEAGIDAAAEAIMVSHNIVTSIDPNNPASLSSDIHTLLRNNLNFTGVIMTDDLAMGALDNIDNKVVKAILAGNDILIVTDYASSINEVKNALDSGILDEDDIDSIITRNIAWKYYKGLMSLNNK